MSSVTRSRLSQSAQVATNFKHDLIAALPSNRTLDAMLLMAPAVHPTGPRGAYTINGSQSYENLWIVNGAVINENLRGLPMTPYIEDAIQEVTIATSGVSAEYGRFAGGVATAVTKSGGNIFSGSFRTTFANDSWRSFTPFESTDLITEPSTKAVGPQARQHHSDLRGDCRRSDSDRSVVVLRRDALAGAEIAAHDRPRRTSRTRSRTTSSGTKGS